MQNAEKGQGQNLNGAELKIGIVQARFNESITNTLFASCRDELLAGLPGNTPAAIIQHASLPHQRHALTFLQDLPECIAENQLGSPSIIVVGDVVQGIAAWQNQPQALPQSAAA